MITVMNYVPKQLALIGPTASGKTALSIELAQRLNAYILSLDSLSIYKEIDIVSAKPTVEERADIPHYGIDYLYANENFDVTVFIKLYQEVYSRVQAEKKNLVIVGGTSFYLKMLVDGISQLPSLHLSTIEKTHHDLKNLQKSYQMLYTVDPDYMVQISPSDRYRIEKALNIYYETGMIPTRYFKQNRPLSAIRGDLPIYRIDMDKEKLRERIAQRTKLMLKDGLIDEICMLEHKYTRIPHCMKAIGIKETLGYLDGIYDKKMLEEKITTNTARLAKRQTTFNHSQFKNVVSGSVETLKKILLQS